MSRKTLPERAHEWFHGLPGVPDHPAAERLNHRDGRGGPRPSLGNYPFHNLGSGHHAHPRHNPPAWHGREPRVLIGWQRAIGRLVARMGGRR